MFSNAEGTILENIYLVHVPIGSDILSITQEYGSYPDVVYAEPNMIGSFCGIPNDGNFGIQWSLHNTGQMILGDISGTPDADIDALEAWDITTGNQDVVIAVIDSGIDYTHPDLAANIWNNNDEIPNNNIDDDNNEYIDDVMGWDFAYDNNNPKDEWGHGTACAGIAAAVTDNNIGIAGVGWNCKIMCIKVGDEYNVIKTDNFVAGIKYAADNGAGICSMSIAFTSVSNILEDAVNYAYGKGVFLCAAVHNYNESKKYYPAAYENVTAVAATNQNDERCTSEDWGPGMGSNYGDYVDIAAPGNLLLMTLPTYHVWINYMPNYHTGKNYSLNYDYGGGTSLATPMVAGIAALLLSYDPSLSPDEVKALLCDNVDPYNSTVYIGTGRLNAQKALYALTTRLPPNTPTITGETKGDVQTLYDYTIQTTDPELHEVKYQIDWGDNTTIITGLSGSGEEIVVSHTWDTKGTYNIQVKAIDKYGAESDWGSLTVTMPCSYTNRPLLQFLELLFERFPNAFPILKHLLGY
jgi:subtilisin family serine protease